MNVFELGFIACPVAGIVSGAHAVESSGAASIVAGAIAGTVIGVATSLTPVLVAGVLMSRTDRILERRFSLRQWSCEMAIVLWAGATPFAAWFATAFCVSRILGPSG